MIWTRDVLERAIWTFLEAALASLPVTMIYTPDALQGMAWSALTAGIAAVISLGKNLAAEGAVVEAARRATEAAERQRPKVKVAQPHTGTTFGTAVVIEEGP